MKKPLLVLLLSVLLPSNVLAIEWVRSSPPTSCAEVCNGKAVSSGKDRHGYAFYVCRGYIKQEWRPGFNIATSQDSANKCLFEWSRRRGESQKYDCLCDQ